MKTEEVKATKGKFSSRDSFPVPVSLDGSDKKERKCLGRGLVAKSCSTLCNSTDCSPPGSSVRGILQARILHFVAISFSRGSFQPMVREHKLKKGNQLICHSQAGGG